MREFVGFLFFIYGIRWIACHSLPDLLDCVESVQGHNRIRRNSDSVEDAAAKLQSLSATRLLNRRFSKRADFNPIQMTVRESDYSVVGKEIRRLQPLGASRALRYSLRTENPWVELRPENGAVIVKKAFDYEGLDATKAIDFFVLINDTQTGGKNSGSTPIPIGSGMELVEFHWEWNGVGGTPLEVEWSWWSSIGSGMELVELYWE
ncbi:hypothetical protein BV898_14731 [Hypsibius exemplaris]|uniref:Uncharacterized protein n=1 Tax=Hypsibius exemplaris TaxID=2072580 RepID=A0A9X6NCG9_HYPEX|nr:hypothetical protein BV898_14731 [Hypsibius exemplaris]